MFVLINGSFGIGKTTVAKELRSLLRGSAIFDPEWVGLALQRVPGRHVSDFQDLPSWRRLTVLGARGLASGRGAVIIPMAFSEEAYLNEVRSGLAKSGRPVFHFCLTAPIEVVRDRLAARGERTDDPAWGWVHRRAEECCRAHKSDVFATHIETHGRSSGAIATELLTLIR